MMGRLLAENPTELYIRALCDADYRTTDRVMQKEIFNELTTLEYVEFQYNRLIGGK